MSPLEKAKGAGKKQKVRFNLRKQNTFSTYLSKAQVCNNLDTLSSQRNAKDGEPIYKITTLDKTSSKAKRNRYSLRTSSLGVNKKLAEEERSLKESLRKPETKAKKIITVKRKNDSTIGAKIRKHKSYSPPKKNIKLDIYKDREVQRNFFGNEIEEEVKIKKEKFKMPWVKQLINEDYNKDETYGMLYNQRLSQTENRLKFASSFMTKSTPKINFKYLKRGKGQSSYDLYQKSSRDNSRKRARTGKNRKRRKKKEISEKERKLIKKKVSQSFLSP